MKLPIIVLLTLNVVLFSCNNSKEGDELKTKESTVETKVITPNVYITTRTYSGSGDDIEQDSIIEKLESNYVDFTLYFRPDKKWQAEMEGIRPESAEEFFMVTKTVTDSIGNLFKFEDRNDFLKFMYNRGFYLVDIKLDKSSYDITFKRK